MPERIYKTLLCFLLLTLTASLPLWAKEQVTVAVLPFSIHSAENIDYVQQGVMDMLSSRISANDKINVVAKEKVLEAMKTIKSKDLSLQDIQGLGKKLNVDYVVAGSITKIGNSVSIDGKFMSIAENKTPVNIFTQSPGMDDVILKINDFAQRINQFVMGAPAEGGTPAPVIATAPSSAPAAPQAPGAGGRETQIIAGMKSGRKSTYTGSMNPDFVTGAMPLDKKGFWMSQKYPTEFRGLDIGDVNGDGLNEIVTIDITNIYIFQKKGNEMQLLHKISGKGEGQYIGVDLVNLTGGRAKDIVVSNIFTTRTNDMINHSVQSFILSWKDGKFQRTADNLPWIFRVIGNGQESRFVGQALSVAANSPSATSKPFDTPIYEMVWRNGKLEEGKKLKVPNGLCIYGLTIDNLGQGKDKIIAMDTYDHLMVLDESDQDLSKILTLFGNKAILYQSDEVFGGSNININMYGSDDGGLPTYFNLYFNPRILTFDAKGDGNREILMARNDGPGGRIMKNMRIFTTTEFYNFQWDSLGLSENWRTKKLRGYAADYQIKDIDNDGENEIAIALVTSAGSLASRSSVIVSYKMKAQ